VELTGYRELAFNLLYEVLGLAKNFDAFFSATCISYHNAVDGDGNTCIYYDSKPSACGQNDTTDFVAADLCCACI
jgi:hypothetical protein